MSSRGLRSLGRSGLRVSPLCLGAMNFGNEQFGCDEETSSVIIQAYLDAGHNFIDTANVYSGMKSEVIVGKAVKGRRDSVVIATKAASPLGPGPFDSGTSRKHVTRACEESLRRLRERLATELIRRHRLNERAPVEPPIYVEQRASFGDEVRVPKIKRAVEVPEVCVAQVFEDR